MASSPYDRVFVYPDPSLLNLRFPLHQETDIGAALPLRPETPAYPSIRHTQYVLPRWPCYRSTVLRAAIGGEHQISALYCC